MPVLTDKQFASVRDATAPVNVWEGAVSSGKTIGSLLKFLLKVSNPPPGGEIVVVGRTRDSVGRNLFGPLSDPELFGSEVANQVHYNPGAPSATVLGRRVHVLGASDSRAEGVIRGLTVGVAYVDEATLISEAFWMQLQARMRVEGAQILATTNPDGPAHWFKTGVLDRAAERGHAHFHFVLDDNPFLPRGYVANLKQEYRGLWYRRFVLGEWVQAAGAIFDVWDEARHVVDPAEIPTMERVLAMGIDHGTTNPTRGLLIGLGEGKLWVLDEWAPPTGLTDGQQSALLRAWVGTREPEWRRYPDWYYVDPAAASFRKQMFADGFINTANAHNDVLAGIRTVSSLLAVDRLKVSRDCEHLITQLPGYVWDPKATAKGEDKPIKLNDHEVDALRYGVHSTRSLWRDSVPLIAARPEAPGADERQAA